MKFIVKLLTIVVCLNLFIQSESTLIIKPLTQSSEDRGKGITDQ